MPRLTESSRQARREEIADAALRCVARVGFTRTTMADIIAESGLSAGSIYSHFPSKAELVRFASSSIFTTREDRLETAFAELGTALTPAQVMSHMLPTGDNDPGFDVLVQIWAESLTDPELGEVVSFNVARLRAVIETAITPWAATRTSSDEAAATLADKTAGALLTLMQGYIVQAAIGTKPEVPELVRLLVDAIDDRR
jgi:AcrR family transcriptional regulator